MFAAVVCFYSFLLFRFIIAIDNSMVYIADT